MSLADARLAPSGMSDDLDLWLDGFELYSSDAGGLPIKHWPCGEYICDAEGGDSLAVLVRMALDHKCEVTR